jgi:hypothetical protein
VRVLVFEILKKDIQTNDTESNKFQSQRGVLYGVGKRRYRAIEWYIDLRELM